jgi:hypothetical protein
VSATYEFATPEWLAALHAAFASAAAHGDLKSDRDFTLCEVYTDVPSHIPSDNGTIAFTVVISDGGDSVDFERGEAADPDRKVTASYEALLPIARAVAGDDPEAQRAMRDAVAAAVEAGDLVAEGEPRNDNSGTIVHDTIARLTA